MNSLQCRRDGHVVSFMFKRSYLCVVMLLLGVNARAGEHDDLLGTWLARKILADDAQLAPHNVGVAVKGSVVVLWGSVPSMVHVQRAGSLLKTQFAEVRNELVVVAEEDPWPIHVGPRSSGALAGRIENEQPAILKPQPPMKSFEQRVQELHGSRLAYQSFAVTIEGRTIIVAASAQSGEILQEFMTALSRLSGVERVVLRPN